jgi:hypothetical protein
MLFSEHGTAVALLLLLFHHPKWRSQHRVSCCSHYLTNAKWHEMNSPRCCCCDVIIQDGREEKSVALTAAAAVTSSSKMAECVEPALPEPSPHGNFVASIERNENPPGEWFQLA